MAETKASKKDSANQEGMEWPTCKQCGKNPVEKDYKGQKPFAHGRCGSCRIKAKILKDEFETGWVFSSQVKVKCPFLKNIVRWVNMDFAKDPDYKNPEVIAALTVRLEAEMTLHRHSHKRMKDAQTKYTDSFYDLSNPYRRLEEIAKKLTSLGDDIFRDIRTIKGWMDEDKKDDNALLKRLTLGEMFNSIPVEMQDQAIEALQGAVDVTGGEM